jgi:uncharacterized protein
MQTRALGRTGVPVGVIGLGCEYLLSVPADEVTAVIHRALDHGVNYFDLFYGQPAIRDYYGAALAGRRDKALVAGHLGATVEKDQYALNRDLGVTQRYFDDMLTRLRSDYLDVVMLHNCDGDDAYGQVMQLHLPLARRYVEQGKARFIGFSTHTAATGLKAVTSGAIDVLLYQMNIADHAAEGRDDLLAACVRHNVGVVVMKAFGGGKLLKEKPTPGLTPVRCLSYVLSQPAVCCVVPGVKNVAELDAALAYVNAVPQERDFSAVLKTLSPDLGKGCVYCNHCLPCPQGIDIGRAQRLLDMQRTAPSKATASEYAGLEAKASNCVECGACVERCPWGVDVIKAMREAAGVFGG